MSTWFPDEIDEWFGGDGDAAREVMAAEREVGFWDALDRAEADGVQLAPMPRTEVERSIAQDMQDEFPEGCGVCGEPLDHETGEFWDEVNDRGVVAHAECGIGQGWRMA